MPETHRVTSPAYKKKKVLVAKIKPQGATIRELQAAKQSLKILLEELAPQPVEKKRKGRRALFSRLDVKYVRIASSVLNTLSELCAKETCELDSFSKKRRKR